MTVYKCDDYEYVNKNFGERLLTQEAKTNEENLVDEVSQAVRAVVEHEEQN